MTNQMTAPGASTTDPRTPLRAVALLSLVGGASWVVDTVTIAVLNRSFDPLDSVLFFLGAACLVLTLVALAVHVSAGRTGAARLRVALAAFFATTAVLSRPVEGIGQLLGMTLSAKTVIDRHLEVMNAPVTIASPPGTDDA